VKCCGCNSVVSDDDLLVGTEVVNTVELIAIILDCPNCRRHFLTGVSCESMMWREFINSGDAIHAVTAVTERLVMSDPTTPQGASVLSHTEPEYQGGGLFDNKPAQSAFNAIKGK